jgi:iron complex transport system ATP-binding protein
VRGHTVLTVDAVGVTIDGREILDDVSLDVVAGEVLALVGPNGAGKSTLLNAITGDVELSAGAVHLGGVPIGTWDPTELAMRRSVLLQRVDVSFPFTVGEVVEMGRSPWAGTPAELDDDLVVRGAMRLSDVSDLADRAYTSLSGGERGRAAFARVLAQAAPLMLLDEPTAAMDIRHQELVLRLARDYAATGSAVVVVVHALDVAAAYADRVALLSRGRLRDVGTPEQVLTAEQLSDVYQYEIEVIRHPRTGGLLVLPVRATRKDADAR